MFQYRQVLVRLRAGDSLRDVARSGLMGRDKPRTSSSVEPHREVVRRWVEAGVHALSRPMWPERATSRNESPARSRTSTCRYWNISILLRPMGAFLSKKLGR